MPIIRLMTPTALVVGVIFLVLVESINTTRRSPSLMSLLAILKEG